LEASLVMTAGTMQRLRIFNAGYASSPIARQRWQR
jgi:hypothetical protein